MPEDRNRRDGWKRQLEEQKAQKPRRLRGSQAEADSGSEPQRHDVPEHLGGEDLDGGSASYGQPRADIGDEMDLWI